MQATIGERIKEVRLLKGYTQQAFADKLGLKRNTVGGYEINSVTPSDRTISDICDKFGVSEDWLRTGEGEMQTPISRDAAIATFMGDVMSSEDADFRRRLVAALSKLDTAEWEILERVALKLVDECKKEDPA